MPRDARGQLALGVDVVELVGVVDVNEANAQALATRDTWSGLTVAWPIDGACMNPPPVAGRPRSRVVRGKALEQRHDLGEQRQRLDPLVGGLTERVQDPAHGLGQEGAVAVGQRAGVDGSAVAGHDAAPEQPRHSLDRLDTLQSIGRMPSRRFALAVLIVALEGAPKLPAVRVRVISDMNALQAELQSGRVDIAPMPTSLSPDAVKRLEQDPNLQVKAFPGSNVVLLTLNTASPPLDNVKVRQAIAYAIDRLEGRLRRDEHALERRAA